MTIVTRYAPTISGELHIGSLYNALLNYLFAKKHGGLFKLRLDGLDLNPPHDVWQKNIEQDIIRYGLVPDEVIRASERLELYKGVARELDRTCDRSYHCDCTVQNLLKRAEESDLSFYHLYRPEKYPPYCRVAQVIVRGPDSDVNLASGCSVRASHEHPKHPVSCLTARKAQVNKWWEPVDVGYQNHPVEPEVVIDLGEEKDICSIEIVWKDRPALNYRIFATKDLVHVVKSGKYFVDYKDGQPFPPLTGDRHNFATTKVRYVHILFFECAIPVDKPYFYDYHCRNLGKKLDLDHKNTVLRLRADESCSKYDTAYWYSRLPNLVLTSSFDDKELNVTHCIRGRDIEPWIVLEGQVALALGVPAKENLIHGLVVNTSGYKYSKWIKSTPAREYLQGQVTPDKVLSYLAYKIGIIEEYRVCGLEELVSEFKPEHISRNDILIDEQEMLTSIA